MLASHFKIGNKRKFIINHIRRERKDFSKWFLIPGSILCGISILTSILSVSLPYWINVNEVMETTVAGLTDDTDVTYFYGLLRYCLKMKATHLDTDECKAKDYSSLTCKEVSYHSNKGYKFPFLDTAFLL